MEGESESWREEAGGITTEERRKRERRLMFSVCPRPPRHSGLSSTLLSNKRWPYPPYRHIPLFSHPKDDHILLIIQSLQPSSNQMQPECKHWMECTMSPMPTLNRFLMTQQSRPISYRSGVGSDIFLEMPSQTHSRKGNMFPLWPCTARPGRGTPVSLA